MRALAIILLLFLAGCGTTVGMNPSFPLAEDEASATLSRLKRDPMALQRPLVILAGFQDPGFGSVSVAKRFRRLVSNPEMVISISFFANGTFDDCRRKAIEEVDAAFGGGSSTETIEVDVVGISMGGLVARHAAREDSIEAVGKRLNIHTLYSVGTPHQGAKLANLPTLDDRQRDMRPGSQFLTQLNSDLSSRDFEIVAYGRAGDEIVGLRNTAPPEGEVWWLPNRRWQSAHLTSASDPRIVADIAQRLRGARPFTRGRPAPPP